MGKLQKVLKNAEDKHKKADIKVINKMITQYINFMQKQGYGYDSPEDKAVLELLNIQWIEHCKQKKLSGEAYMLFSFNILRMQEKSRQVMDDLIRKEDETTEDYMERLKQGGFTNVEPAEA